ncbi:pentatricopeptide repeat-containing protein At4g02750-like [Selaginella moellendorffii]|uniref:pentatricopeptide repeat-containing protein At4g02750-like n=1 Tax=Selaginella moellendorffii TaxID=88036 RepID=UPI000D1CE2D6|nr:pentatricopeptide repeat-containing protein At4g02750-like [Selaginella moellendorffii]|eukprot:XP_024536420.1 pentatricopeptide repeat-containing protein At4g02750-like [Selaginella moellendorffii]
MPQRDLVAWNAMIGAYSQHGRVEQAKFLFDSMAERNLVSWTSMLTPYTISGYFSQAKLVFLDMSEQNSVSWNAILCMYAQHGHLSSARKIFDAMPEQGVVSWSAMLAAHVRNLSSSRALELFDEMKALHCPDEASFFSAMVSFGQQGCISRAKSCFCSMVADYEVAPSKQHYSCMVDLLVRSGRSLEACLRCLLSPVTWNGRACCVKETPARC